MKEENQSQNKDLKPQIKVTEEFKGTKTLEDIIKELNVKSLNLDSFGRHMIIQQSKIRLYFFNLKKYFSISFLYGII